VQRPDPIGSTLFAYVEIEDEARWNTIAATRECQKWWKHERSYAGQPGSQSGRPQTA
jgi:L-rhamnose mutarotase